MNPVNEPKSASGQQSSFRILHTEWSTGWGGQEHRILLECQKMEERGHRMLIACQPGSGILGRARACGLRTEEVVIRGSFDPRAILALRRIIRREQIQVVNTHSGKDSWAGGFAAKLAGADLLVRSRHLSVPISNHSLNFVYSMTDGIITTGEAIRDSMIGNNGIDPAKIISIATGVSLGRFNPEFANTLRLRSEFGISADAVLLTMVAVLRSMKRHDLFLRAAVELKQRFRGIRFLLVGEGPGRATIEQLIRDFGLTSDCILAGYRDDIPDILAASDIVALTSDRFEGVPQSLSQAMAMARPIVAAPVGSIEELVLHERTGLIAEAGNAESFARQIARLVADPALRATLGKAAREHILASYTDDIMARRTEEFYWRLLERKRLRAAA
jgi:glycosyltransferase involved in cell wall biosynthesis